MSGDKVVTQAESPVSFSHVFLKPFTRNKMRSLVEKWDQTGRLNRDLVLDRMSEEFLSINIPMTAVNGTILLTIYEAQSTYKPINRAALIERFVEHLLEKRSLKDAERGTFDFTNKVHVLSYLAEHMAQNDRYVVTAQEARDVINEYLRNVGLVQDAAELVATFVNSRVLASRPDSHLSFRYRAFLEYFVACRMGFTPRFKSWVLEDSRYLSYINEIQYYAGVDRDDAELLSLVGDRFEALTNRVIEEMKWSPDLGLLDKFRLPGEDAKEDVFSEFERQIQAPPLTPEERDEAFEGEVPQDSESRQEVFRPRMENVGQRWATCLLLYSGVLKNMELIPDLDKRGHLARVLRGWGILTLQSLWVVPLLAKHRHMRINGVQYEVMLPRHYSEGRVARTICLELPNSIGYLAKTMLGTEKLERQLTEPSLDEANEAAILTYFRYSLIADLRLGDWCGALSSLHEKLKGAAYLREVLLRKVGYIYFLGFDLRANEARLRTLAGKMIGAIRGGSRSDRMKAATSEIEALKRKELVRRLRLIASDTSSRGD
jgi:hypothetical protein